MSILPVRPQTPSVTSSSADAATPAGRVRRTFGVTHPSRRTFGVYHPSRRAFGRYSG